MKLQRYCLLALSMLMVQVLYCPHQPQLPKGLSWTDHYGTAAIGGLLSTLMPFTFLDNGMKLVACGVVGELLRHRANHLAKQYEKDKVEGVKRKTDFRPLIISLCKWTGLLCTIFAYKDALPYLLKNQRTALVINWVDTKGANGIAYVSPAFASTTKEYHLPSAFFGILGATALACYDDKKSLTPEKLD